MKLNFITITFMLLTGLPRGVKAETTEIKQCLRDVQAYWLSQSPIQYKGHTRTDSPCELSLKITPTSLIVLATSSPLSIDFELKDSTMEETRTLQTCRVDKEKVHFVFEEKSSHEFEKREHIQMTLLRREGNGLSLILSKRENKILRPLQQSSLICHLN